MARLRISLALPGYEHALDLLSGRITAEGLDINWIRSPLEEIARRFTDGEFDVADMPLADVVTHHATGRNGIIALPVFTSRLFVQGALWVTADSTLRDTQSISRGDLRFASNDLTAAMYFRAWLRHEGLSPATVEVCDHSAAFERLAAANLDAVVSCAGRGNRTGIHRLTESARTVEHAYFRDTGIFPILRVLCVQREIAERNPWIARSLFDAFTEAKHNSLQRLITAGMSRYPMPWINAYIVETRAVFGDDFWPYGIAANARTLDAFLNEARDSGMIDKEIPAEKLFHPATVTL